ncbi:hypothetical protein [Clostridium sp. YIM B02506]|uniref:hypothetical protein n=1 Tax=Clostridium sp. YIM B02506 TaxID=2910680 RepID=UPI001EED8A82|nr:hypothetical protein [Clostridium sp. YIM B02506]
MSRSKLLDFILKIKVATHDESENNIIGTAFIMDNMYAITAAHVVNKYKEEKLILETHDRKHIISECMIDCSVFIEEKGIDIAIIKYNYDNNVFTETYPLCSDEVNLNEEYETYGFPKLNKYNEFYISGEVISPEGRLCIKDSSGEHKSISLYKGVSGAPLIIGNSIKGIISDELLTSKIHKPELLACQFHNVMEYLNSSELSEDEAKIYRLLECNCKRNISNIDRLDPFYKMYDEEYANIKDKKNLGEKILNKCPDFPKSIIRSWNRKCVQARIDLERTNSEQKKAVLMVVFSSCIEYIEEELISLDISNTNQLKECINELKSKTIRTVKERQKDFDYGINNIITFENTIFNLIDSCFLSFDDYLEEEKNVLE